MYFIIIMNAIVYFFQWFDKSGTLYNLLVLDPALVMQGQIWRLVTYIFIPPQVSLLFIVFMLLFYYTAGVGLEQEWGSFKFNLYYLIGMIATTIAAFFTHTEATALYLNLSLFLAFAHLFPTYEILLFMFIPLKVKYLAWFYWAFFIYTIISAILTYSIYAPQLLFGKIAVVVASIVNYLIFFGPELIQHNRRRRQVYDNRKRIYSENTYIPPVHACEYCGVSEKSDPDMEFFHCPECDLQYEYCRNHIQNHKHVKK
jgi:Uncharacterized membrane protein (homolog of Drosophila rhomboid)